MPNDSQGGPARPMRVLVVEDRADAAESLALLLRLYGHEVDVTAGCEQALRSARLNTPDAVLMDIGRPGCDGYAVARRLLEDLPTRPLVVAITGHGMPSDHERSVREGFDHQLVKPVDLDHLARLLRGHADALGRA